MASRAWSTQALVLEGEVVGVLREEGHRLVKVAVNRPRMVEVVMGARESFHLGDRVLVHVRVSVEDVKRCEEDRGPE